MIAVIGSGPSAFAVSTLLDELGIEFGRQLPLARRC